MSKLLDKWFSDTHPDNQERKEFCGAMSVLFPHMSDSMVVKCWRAIAAGDGYHRSHLTRELFAAALHVSNRRVSTRGQGLTK